MAKRSKRRRSAKESPERQESRQREAERQEAEARRQWESRRTRNLIIGCVLGILAVVASLGWSLRSAANDISTAVASDLGPTTTAVPNSTLGNFHPIGTELKAGRKPQVMMIGTMFCE